MSSEPITHSGFRRSAAALEFLEEIAVATNELNGVETVFRYALQRACAYTQACLGHVFLVDPNQADQLIPSTFWEGEDLERFAHLRTSTEALVLKRGELLPGKVMLHKRAEAIYDLNGVPFFRRAREAQSAGLHSWIAFPALAGEEVVAVFEFFSQKPAALDEEVLNTLNHAGTLLGRVVERQQAEEALRASEVRFRTIFQGVGAGIELLDLEGRLLAFNPAVCRFFGYSAEEMVKEALGRSIHPSNAVLGDAYFSTLAAGKVDLYTLERRYRHKEGELIWGRSTVSLVRDLSHSPQYAICMLENVNELRQMEAERNELHRRLMEGKEEERLRLAREIHDGPIQDLYGLMYALKASTKDNPDLPVEETLERIESVIGTLREMSSELRPSTLAPFGLEKSIRSHAETFQAAHPDLQLHLELSADGTSLPEAVRLALFRIYQVALTNILRHAEASQAEIRFELEPEQAWLEIRDNGKGFTPPARWIQLARKGHLGLVGAVERAESVGGKLEIESSPGAGTVLRVSVPLIPPDLTTNNGSFV